MIELRFTVEGKPQTWQRTNTVRGRKLTPKDQRSNQRAIQWAAVAAMRPRSAWVTDARFGVEIDAYAARRDFDLDNLAKQIGDAGNGVIWLDDRRIDSLTVRRHVDREHERVEVLVRRIVAPMEGCG